MFQLDYKDSRPLYEQIKDKIKMMVIKGVLKPNQRIPSVRELAQSLTINPNTIQKAYKDLEGEGFIYSIRAKGSFVTPREHQENQERRAQVMSEMEKLVGELKFMQVPKEKIISAIEKIYEKREAGVND